jgi:hypothetical protein
MAINRFNGLPFSLENQKPLKRLENQESPSLTRLKPGENEREPLFDDRA